MNKRVKKDYHSKNLSNPFFHHSSPKHQYHLQSKWRWLLIFIISSFLIWFFLIASFWKIQKIQLIGLQRLQKREVLNIVQQQSLQKRWLFFKQNNIFLFNSGQVSQKIISDYDVSSIRIEKHFPHALTIKLTERPISFIFKEGSQLFYASADAHLIRRPAVNAQGEKKYFLLENKRSDSLINDNKINIKTNYLKFILHLHQVLSTHPSLPVTKFIIDSEFDTVEVKFTNGPLVYFNTTDKVNSQVNILSLVKKQKIKDNFKRTEYIDLRYGNKVFIYPNFN